ncbi:hypothetical protein RchiOBHm_Chr7g0234591 [Rosa chinensis]|uniref:Uncharacterized protein n=1 Tax=Rosa chinensis TaxID=74649 RepID=A0A2P6PGG9_ROSCH|nr:hypothetical protein RchiOBHm_Chr7g0234591 [Rosa chinensis]
MHSCTKLRALPPVNPSRPGLGIQRCFEVSTSSLVGACFARIQCRDLLTTFFWVLCLRFPSAFGTANLATVNHTRDRSRLDWGIRPRVRNKTASNHLQLGRLLETTTMERGGAGLIGFIWNPIWSAAEPVWLMMKAVLGYADPTMFLFPVAVSIVYWLWWNIWAGIRGSDTKDLIRLWVPRLFWVAVQVGCLWTLVQTRIWVTSRAGVLSLWWMFDRPKLLAAPSSGWSPAKKLLLGLKLGPPSGLGALVSFGLLLGSRMSSGAFSLDELLVQPRAWTIDSGPGLFGFGVTGGHMLECNIIRGNLLLLS